MTTKNISFIVPTSFQIPSFLNQASPEQVGQVLQLADALLETGATFKHDIDVKQLREKIHELESCTVESLRDEAIRIVKAEQRAESTGYQRRLEEKDQIIDDLKTEKSYLNKLVHQKDQKIDEKDAKIGELQDKLQERIAIQSNSSKRGKEGEKDFETLTTNMKAWRLESVGKTKESADFHTVIQTVDVRFEVKNHDVEVPYIKNVDKFERDMKEHPETKLGVFVALKARIERLDDEITIRWTDDKQLLVFIPYFLSRDHAYTYDLIEGFVRIMKYLKPYLETKDTSKEIEVLTDKITMSITNIQRLDKEVSEMYKDHHDYSTRMQAKYKLLQSYILSTLSVLTGKEQEEMKPKAKGRKKKESTD